MDNNVIVLALSCQFAGNNFSIKRVRFVSVCPGIAKNSPLSIDAS